ncbi:MAG: type II secretion system protein [Acidobacteriota bacterium]
METASNAKRRRGALAGYTLVEMLIVVTLVGIVATMALPSFVHSSRKAREAVLRHDLWILRSTIDQYFTDKGAYPQDLDQLVQAGYIRAVPIDPITEEQDWEEIWGSQLADDEPEGLSGEGGLIDVRSSSSQKALDGTVYSEW